MRYLLLVSLFLSVPFAVVAQAVAPRIDAHALDGAEVHLPAAGQPALLILGFSRKASDGVTVCSKVLSHTAWNNHAATVYEVAFLDPVPKLLRGLVVKSIRKDVPVAAQGHFLTVDADSAAWKSIAGVTVDDVPYLVLVDGVGKVRWHAAGPCSEALYGEVARQVGALGAK